MKNIFEETYTRIAELKKAYDAAKDEDGREKARTAYNDLLKPLAELGSAAGRLWREYEIARDNGNSILDISEVVWEKDVKSLISCMRRIGIEEFTFSSAWSSAVETAWLFKQSGCELEGLVEINGSMNFFDEKREKKHGYLFRVN